MFSSFQILLGLSNLALYALYPFFQGKALFDVLHHVLRYVLIFFLTYGSGSWSLDDFTVVLSLLTVVSFSVAGELISGLHQKERSKGTVSLLGERKSSMVAILSIIVAALSLVCVLDSLFEFPIQVADFTMPFYVLPSLMITYLFVKPLIRVARNEHVEIWDSCKRRELLIAAIVSAIVLIILLAGEVNIDRVVNTRNYDFTLELKTIVAGKYDWNVPWILFDYIDPNNYYYFLLHKNGILELGRVSDGQYQGYLATLNERVNTFQLHRFDVHVNNTIVITLDRKYSLTAPRNHENNTSRITLSSTRPCPWLAYVYGLDTLPNR